MVNFFEHQQQAKRNTTLLVVLFFIALLLIVGIVTLAAAMLLGYVDQQPGQTLTIYHGAGLFWVAFIVTSGIGLVMLFKWLQLKPGGHVVAESLGGVRIAPDSRDPLERRILNTVEEMAIAANMPVPAVYLLPDEAAINAFAAGYATRDAVIGLTRGAAETFSREQLQAVVAHEFSHILNGDMRMNIRLIAALAGILALAHLGEMLLRSARFSSRSRNQGANPLPFIGLALLLIGWIGVLFGSLIKAAVSRQREYLADAAAVQFTRNPQALSGALQQIGARQYGSRLQHKNTAEASHLFFGNAVKNWFGIMATHPPLDKRIRRLEPHWNGHYPEPKQAFGLSEAQQQAARSQPQALQQLALLALPAVLLEQARSPQQAPQLVRELIAIQLTQAGDRAEVNQLNASQVLALVELAVPALRLASESDRVSLLHDLEHLAAGEDLFHWCLYQLLARQLLPAKRFSAKCDAQQAFDQSIAALVAAEAGRAFDRDALTVALNSIRDWAPQAKQSLLERWLQTVQQDGKVSLTEQKLIATLCACVEQPLPDALLQR